MNVGRQWSDVTIPYATVTHKRPTSLYSVVSESFQSLRFEVQIRDKIINDLECEIKMLEKENEKNSKVIQILKSENEVCK